MYDKLKEADPETYGIISKELERQQNGLEMIPSESFASLPVLEALGSIMNNKYSEGYPKKRYYGGNEFIDEAEILAIERAKKLFGAEHANVQPYSGSPANLEAYFALLKPGDTVMGMNLTHGGHLTHGHKVNFTGKTYNFVQYGVDEKTEMLDMDAVRKMAKECNPKMIVSGFTAYPRSIDFKQFHEIAEEVGAYSMADISHIAGLIAGGAHPSPFPFFDLVTTTTHKTLCGPRGAIIMSKIEDRLKEKYHPNSKLTLARRIDRAVFPGMQGGPHNHQIAAKAVAFGLALKPEFKDWAAQVVKNSKSLADSLMNQGIRLVSGGTDNHLILADLTSINVTGQEAETALDEVGITVNKNTIPFEKRSPFDPSGIRMGTPALTNRGFTASDMTQVGELMAKTVKNVGNKDVLEDVKKQVLELAGRHPLYSGLN
ncbi:serine hydroxymethyltransferase [Candidatus Woesearchaeota archaeon]|jgi:glycine hydroxymethyltransferase|nr:serine hydroxymethyltransferase [Candidatus Woesearchaeota archaeon]MBT3537639.1 serine hydroxymethyltransferase [Candidatus Woesearchaeota archaeon]MBT4698427.1 serine hydroxymethyltransferase [Candidatus Woesearchaeota archaeon]MBT4716664.1 serine hydroxymethyltransferase [Candidatus Woesearchaeota archaeon]MBT7105308.1 serine hydroxymethyltransferase [Candidatus Woesearchaeota archaeon]